MVRRSSSLAIGFGVALVTAGVGVSLHAAQGAGASARPALFTNAQATAGEAVYTRACAACHGRTLTGGSAPPLTGPAFAASWRNPRVTLDDLFFVMRTTMPPRQTNALSADERVAVFAYILSVNGYPAGSVALTTTTAALTDLHLDMVEPERFRQFVAHLQSEPSDAVVITGDISRSNVLLEHLAILEDLLRVPIYFVLGNHDFYGSSIAETRASVR